MLAPTVTIIKNEVRAALEKMRPRVVSLLVALVIMGLIALYLINGRYGAPLT